MLRLALFLSKNRAGRKLVILVHPRVHSGWTHPLRFMAGGGCWLCNLMSRPFREMVAREQPFPDETSIKISDPVYAEDGTVIRRGVSMSATAKRQLDQIMANPEQAAAVQKAIDEIADDPGP